MDKWEELEDNSFSKNSNQYYTTAESEKEQNMTTWDWGAMKMEWKNEKKVYKCIIQAWFLSWGQEAATACL